MHFPDTEPQQKIVQQYLTNFDLPHGEITSTLREAASYTPTGNRCCPRLHQTHSSSIYSASQNIRPPRESDKALKHFECFVSHFTYDNCNEQNCFAY